MNYSYIFHSPIKYWVATDDSNYKDTEYILDNIGFDINDIIKSVQANLNEVSSNFVEYMNIPGILDINFNSYDGNILITSTLLDHKLSLDEFKKLYTDIQYQLMDGIGKSVSDICIAEFDDTIEYKVNNISQYKPVKKSVFCLLFQPENWKLQFIRDNRAKAGEANEIFKV